MAPSPVAQPVQLRLPVLVFGVVEVRRLKRELEALEDFMRQSSIREPGKQAQLPRVSRLLDALATDNGLQLLQPGHREQLKGFLEVVEAKAPSLHMSFATDPSSAFTAKMVTWLRANVHPYALLDVGLQPTIAAGCVVRTPNKIFDFSLREQFADAQGLLIKALEAAGPVPAAQPVVPLPTEIAAPQAAPAMPQNASVPPATAAAVSPGGRT